MPVCSSQAVYELSEETALSMSSMYHIQQATAISHQSWLSPGQLAGSAEEAQVCRIPCGHTSSLQNHHPKHCAFSQGSYVGHVALLGPAKSLQQSLLYLLLLSIKKGDCYFFLLSVNRNVWHERLLTFMWLVAVLGSKTHITDTQ